MKFEDLEIGMEVFFVPRYAKGDRNHISSTLAKVVGKHRTITEGVYVQLHEKKGLTITSEIEQMPKWVGIHELMTKESVEVVTRNESNDGCLSLPDWPLD